MYVRVMACDALESLRNELINVLPRGTRYGSWMPHISLYYAHQQVCCSIPAVIVR
jgi:hypothetical protein